MTKQQRTKIYGELKDKADILMSELKMGRGPTKGDQDKAWQDFHDFAKGLKVEYENRHVMRGTYSLETFSKHIE